MWSFNIIPVTFRFLENSYGSKTTKQRVCPAVAATTILNKLHIINDDNTEHLLE
jgi:hypothetical protein